MQPCLVVLCNQGHEMRGCLLVRSPSLASGARLCCDSLPLTNLNLSLNRQSTKTATTTTAATTRATTTTQPTTNTNTQQTNKHKKQQPNNQKSSTQQTNTRQQQGATALKTTVHGRLGLRFNTLGVIASQSPLRPPSPLGISLGYSREAVGCWGCLLGFERRLRQQQ